MLDKAISNDLASIAVEANGGRSILFVYPMEDDDLYIAEARNRLSSDNFSFIDLRESFNDFIKVPVQNAVNSMRRQMDPVVCDTALTEIIGPDLLRTVSRSDLASPEVRTFLMCGAPFQIIEPCAKDLHRPGPVLQL